MARDTVSNASTGGGGSSILSTILPCIRPRRSKQSTSGSRTGSRQEEYKRQSHAETARGQSSQSAGTTLELPNTPLAEDDGDGLEATMNREFARVSVQPVGSPLLPEVGEREIKSQGRGNQQASLAQITDQPQDESLGAAQPHNTVPNIPRESFPDSTLEETTSPAAHEAQPEVPEVPEPIASSLPTDKPVETDQEVAHPDNNSDKVASEQDKGIKQEESLSQEKAESGEAAVPIEMPKGAVGEQTAESTQKEEESTVAPEIPESTSEDLAVESAQKEPEAEVPGEEAEKSERLDPQTENDDAVAKGEETKDSTTA